MFKTFKISLILFCAYGVNATTIQVNQIGYERIGPKTAIFQNDNNSSTADSFKILDDSNNSVFSGKANAAISGWKSSKYQVLDFSSFDKSGTYTIEYAGKKSTEFKIDDHLLFNSTSSSVINFFNSMRNTDAEDHAIPYFSDSSKTHDVYGGWNDATGDKGKYLSHLSYANYFNPQQIPFVIWSLLKSYELDSTRFASITPNALNEAVWGADYLLRVLDKEGFFYITVFDGWGRKSRQICAWENSEGNKTPDCQAALREGGGMSIAALARIARIGKSGDSTSAQYLAGAERAYKHLKEKNLSYTDDHKENIIDDYCGLLAALELYRTTKTASYLTDAENRARKIISYCSDQGWFYVDSDRSRPFNHGADEGLPIVALIEFLKTESTLCDSVKTVLRKSVTWYTQQALSNDNPFHYPPQMALSGGANGTNLALNKTATASQYESTPYKCPAELVVDGDKSTRWASGSPYSDTSWIQIDLKSSYEISKVILNWETACGKEYVIKVSTDGVKWTTAATVANGVTGIKEISFSPVTGRYVRMQGVKPATSYGYSLYEFEVYGVSAEKPKAVEQFFLPHSNETGYWWQGENARLSSLATALMMGIHIPGLFEQDFRTDAQKVATSQLDWILGKNPYGVCMMFGFGQTTYPSYESTTGIKNIKGGICNGITSGGNDDADLAWIPYPAGENFWQNWRWIEQWLPHDAWYLLAIAQQCYAIDNPYSSIGVKRIGISCKSTPMQLNIRNNRLLISIPVSLQQSKENKVEISDLQGRSIAINNAIITTNKVIIPLTQFASGSYFVRINKNSHWQKFSVGF